MRILRAFAAAVPIILLIAVPPAGAELGWPKLTLSTYTGVSSFDDSYGVKSAMPIGGRVGFTYWRRIGLEGTYGKVHAVAARVPDHDFPVDQYGLDVVVSLLPSSFLNPYLFGGWAQLNLDEPGGGSLRLPGGEFGGVVKIRLKGDPGPRWDLRVDARNLMIKNELPLEGDEDVKSHFIFTAGFTVTLPGGEGDGDDDGVLDRFDRCPDTIYGARVDPFGCPLDYDEDGVPDGLDYCPSSPPGAVVDVRGCPTDTDGDGIMDGIDLCDGTPPGVSVDAVGCAMDSDGDGVFDGIDRCPKTPPRVLVDQTGCPLDLAVGGVETALLDSGTLVLETVRFEPGEAQLAPESYALLDEVGDVLARRSHLIIEIAGHTDASGDEGANLRLSRSRAQAVLDYLLRKFPLDRKRFTVVGYGETRPLDTRDSSEAQARNRRVEFKVLNPGGPR